MLLLPFLVFVIRSLTKVNTGKFHMLSTNAGIGS